MATLRDSLKYDLQEGFRDTLESRTGIIGEALRNRRERQEREQETKEQVAEISASTTRLKSTGTTLGNLERSFIQISRNLQLIAKSMKAQVTVQEETDQAMEETKKPAKLAVSRQVEKVEKDDSSLFDKILDLLDGWGRGRKSPKKAKKPPKKTRRGPRGSRRSGPRGGGRVPGRVPPRVPPTGAPERAPPPRVPPPTPAPERAPAPAPAPAPDRGPPPRVPPTPSPAPAPAPARTTPPPKPTVPKDKIKQSAAKRIAKAFAKMGLKSIPILGAAVGVGFAIDRLVKGDPVGAGLEAVGSLGSAITAIPATAVQEARDLYIEFYGVYPEQDTAPDKEQRWKDLYEAVQDAIREELRKKVTEKPEIDYSDVTTDMMGNPLGAPPPLPTPPPPPTPIQRPPAPATEVNPTDRRLAAGTQAAPVQRPSAPAQVPPTATAPSPAAAVSKPSTTAAGASSSGVFSSPGEFVRSMYPVATQASELIGGKVPPIAILGQWAKESGNGKALSAPYNYAGIKAFGSFQKGDYVLTEERYTDAQLARAQAKGETLSKVFSGPDDTMTKGGRTVALDQWYGKGAYEKAKAEGKSWVQVKSYFAKFNDFSDFAKGFASVLMSPRYAKAREQTTPAGFGFEVAKAGYATASAENYSAGIAKFAANEGANVGNVSTAVAAAQRASSTQPNVTVIAAVAPSDTKKAAGTPQPRVERPATVAAG